MRDELHKQEFELLGYTQWSRETKFSSRVSGKFQLSQFQLPRSFCTFSIKIGMSKIQFWIGHHLGLLKDWSCKLSLLYFSVSVSSEFPLYTEIKKFVTSFIFAKSPYNLHFQTTKKVQQPAW